MVQLANKTLTAIEETIAKNQGSSYRGWLGKVIMHMDDAYRDDEFPFRSHLGASGIGNECARSIWYGFRWVTKPHFGGRLLRLFNRGHLEEARFIAMLLAIGCEIFQQDENGKQFRISDAGGHFGGSGDGIVIGLPDLQPNTPTLCEFKTSAEKPFKKIQKEGCRKAKFEHYVQMNVYMRKMGIGVGLYMVVNKNNDELYAEIIPFDAEIADQFIDRGIKLAFHEKAPERISNSPGWFECKWCDHRPVCHLDAKPHVNCRTCEWSVPEKDGTWRCTNKDMPLDYVEIKLEQPMSIALSQQQQYDGCVAWSKKTTL